ncbi:MAG: DUF5659 domain-containing protein [Acidobacteriota bacterium]
MRQEQYFQTSDLSLAVAISLFYPISKIDKENPRKATFFFKSNDQLEGIARSFWGEELKVSPLAYFNQLKAIKTRLYEEGNNG